MTKPKSKTTAADVLRKPSAKKLGLKINPLGMPHDLLVRGHQTPPEPIAPPAPLLVTLAENPVSITPSTQSYTDLQAQSYTDLQTQSYTNSEKQVQINKNKQLTQVPNQSYTSLQSPGYTTEKVYSSVYSSGSSAKTGKIPENSELSNPSYTPLQSRLKSRQTKLVAVRLNVDLLEFIKTFCEQKNETFKEFLEKAAIQRLEGPAIHTSNPMYSHHDDMMINTEDDIIIRAHARFAIQPWTRRDSRDARRFHGTDPRIIEIAMILTVERKLRGNTSKIPIKSFAYFIPEIETLLDDLKNKRLPLALDDYHRYVLDNWERKIKPLRNEKWNITDAQEQEALRRWQPRE
ncbi:MAG: hypothetical protein K1Y36_16790 [Blastocatellia bacterium]|nr:hypothetical protein [Blastocatellia bacterium]